jgi:Predicted nucleotide-binding protein containing TIR-like domain
LFPKKQKIFISVPTDGNLDPDHLAIKQAILHTIEEEGFEPQEFFNSGIPIKKPWSFEAANEVMSHCQGAVILAFVRWKSNPFIGPDDAWYALASEYNYFEGALALSHQVPVLTITDAFIKRSGITSESHSPLIFWPENVGSEWINNTRFVDVFKAWSSEVKSCPDVFLGYCSSAKDTANSIMLYLERDLKLKVLEYSTDFTPGRSILEEIGKATRISPCGIFLFTKDDQFMGSEGHAAPRDNVIFEAGYFMHAKGKEQVLIIREEGAKMPADLGGVIYILLKDRNDVSSIHTQLRHFLENRL